MLKFFTEEKKVETASNSWNYAGDSRSTFNEDTFPCGIFIILPQSEV